MTKATIQDVARVAGVSKATVSRALNRNGYINEMTLKRINQAIVELNYTPSQLAIGLSKNQSNIIGFLVPDICNDFFSEVFYGASKVAEENGKHLMLINTDDNLQIEEEALKTLLSQQICGLIMTPVSDQNENNAKLLKKASKNRIPIVFLDRELEGFNCDGVFVDNISATRAATLLLLKNGHRDIAIVAGPQDTIPGRERMIGFQEAMREKGIEVPRDRILMANFKAAESYQLVRQMLMKKNRPSAIFTSNNQMTIGAVRAFVDLGLKIPDDIAIIGFDDVELLNSFGMKITMIKRATFEMGRVAMNILLSRLAEDVSYEESTIQRVTLQSKMIIRGSEQYFGQGNRKEEKKDAPAG